MWARHFEAFALGHQSIDEAGVFWSGVVVAGGRHRAVKTRSGLVDALNELCVGAETICCTSAVTLAHTLGSDGTGWIDRLVDLTAVVKATSYARTGANRARRRTRAVLARFLRAAAKGAVSTVEAESFLEGRCDELESTELAASALTTMGRLLARAARRQGESKRIIRFEVPAHRALLRESVRPVFIDPSPLREDIDQRELACHTLRAQLMVEIGMDPHDLRAGVEQRGTLLAARGVSGFDEGDLTYGQFLHLCEGSEDDSLKRVAHLKRAERQLDGARSLLLSSPEGVLPEYDLIGTSTGRVLMRTPGIQWLAKEHRSAVVPNDDRTLAYVDYRSFEPTILAISSGDEALLCACHGDLYETLAAWLGLSSESRPFVKVFFLSLMYGRSRGGLLADLARHLGTGVEDAGKRVDSLEARLDAAYRFKASLEREVVKTGRARTINGNWRAIPRERSYLALNHFLQGTAALVFKLALARLFVLGSEVRLVAPMHDAILAEVPTAKAEECVAQMISTMEGAAEHVLGTRIAAVREDWGSTSETLPF